MPIRYIKGDATRPDAQGPRIIVHICNDIGKWGKGFVMALSQRWREPEIAYRTWYSTRKNNDFDLGAVQFVAVAPDLWVANMIGQHDIRSHTMTPPIRYGAVEQGLEKVAAFARQQGASVHMPRIGTGLAGGTWEKIEPLLQKKLSQLDVCVYDR